MVDPVKLPRTNVAERADGGDSLQKKEKSRSLHKKTEEQKGSVEYTSPKSKGRRGHELEPRGSSSKLRCFDNGA